MNKLLRRILILSAMLVLVMSIRSLADSTTYSQRTLTFPNNNGNAGWSNQFTVYSPTTIQVGIQMWPINGSAFNEYNVNTHLSYVLENVYTHVKFNLLGMQVYNRNYTLETAVPAGTYSLGVYYTYAGAYNFQLKFTVTGNGGINVPDELEVLSNPEGDPAKDEVVEIVQQNPNGSVYYVKIESTASSAPYHAEVISKNNSIMPPTITIRGYALGDAYITVYGSDGSIDRMLVHVVTKKTTPTLLDKNLTMGVGDVVYNRVLNTSGQQVTWSSSNTKVAKVNGTGKITAVSVGNCVISAKVAGVKKPLECKVTVARSDPMFIIRMVRIFPKLKRVRVSITNRSGSPMTVLNKFARLTTWPDYTPIRQLSMRNANSVTIPDNRTKAVVFNIKGGAFNLGGKTQNDFGVRIYFKVDGRFFYARCTRDEHLGEYIWRQNFTNSNSDMWLFSYPPYAV